MAAPRPDAPPVTRTLPGRRSCTVRQWLSVGRPPSSTAWSSGLRGRGGQPPGRPRWPAGRPRVGQGVVAALANTSGRSRWNRLWGPLVEGHDHVHAAERLQHPDRSTSGTRGRSRPLSPAYRVVEFRHTTRQSPSPRARRVATWPACSRSKHPRWPPRSHTPARTAPIIPSARAIGELSGAVDNRTHIRGWAGLPEADAGGAAGGDEGGGGGDGGGDRLRGEGAVGGRPAAVAANRSPAPQGRRRGRGWRA